MKVVIVVLVMRKELFPYVQMFSKLLIRKTCLVKKGIPEKHSGVTPGVRACSLRTP